MSLADLALRWILDQPAVSTIIAGVTRPDQLEANAAASAAWTRSSRRWSNSSRTSTSRSPPGGPGRDLGRGRHLSPPLTAATSLPHTGEVGLTRQDLATSRTCSLVGEVGRRPGEAAFPQRSPVLNSALTALPNPRLQHLNYRPPPPSEPHVRACRLRPRPRRDDPRDRLERPPLPAQEDRRRGAEPRQRRREQGVRHHLQDAARGFDRRCPYPGAFGALRLAQVSGQEAVRRAASRAR